MLAMVAAHSSGHWLAGRGFGLVCVCLSLAVIPALAASVSPRAVLEARATKSKESKKSVLEQYTELQLGIVVFSLLLTSIAVSIGMMVMCCMIQKSAKHRDKLEARIDELEQHILEHEAKHEQDIEAAVAAPDQASKFDPDGSVHSSEDGRDAVSRLGSDGDSSTRSSTSSRRSSNEVDERERSPEPRKHTKKSSSAGVGGAIGSSQKSPSSKAAKSIPPEEYPLPPSVVQRQHSMAPPGSPTQPHMSDDRYVESEHSYQRSMDSHSSHYQSHEALLQYQYPAVQNVQHVHHDSTHDLRYNPRYDPRYHPNMYSHLGSMASTPPEHYTLPQSVSSQPHGNDLSQLCGQEARQHQLSYDESLLDHYKSPEQPMPAHVPAARHHHGAGHDRAVLGKILQLEAQAQIRHEDSTSRSSTWMTEQLVESPQPDSGRLDKHTKHRR